MKTKEAEAVDAATVYAKLKSFDHEGLSEDEFATGVIGLLGPQFADAQDVYDYFATRSAPVADNGRPFLQSVEAQRQISDNALENIFTFYNETHPIGAEIDWDYNPGNDHWIHDLNRFSYIPPLVNTGRLTGEQKYLQRAADLILDWVEKNPVTNSWHWLPGKSAIRMPNGAWRSYLNIAIHLRVWAENFAALVPYWSPTALLRILKSVHDQCGYLVDIIPTTSNNWTIIGATGLVSTAGHMPELRIAPEVLSFACGVLSVQAERQILEDGAQFELTQGYHRCVLSLFSVCLNCETLPDVKIPDIVREKVVKMCDYAMQTVLPNGHLAAFNDSDPEQGEAARSLLAAEGRRFGRDDWLYVGTEGAEGQEPEVRSQAFAHAGVYVMRSGWQRKDSCLVFDGGPWGYSHQHDDRLSFQFCALGRSFIVDPGRYLYDNSNPWSRGRYLNTTRAHSTITVDGENQADRYFRELACPGPRIDGNRWSDTGKMQRAAGSHLLGYGENGAVKVVHRRSITFWQPDLVLILDQLSGAGEHAIDSRLQFYPGEVVLENGIWHTTYKDANLAVLPYMEADFSVLVESGCYEPSRGWYSAKVNHIEPAPSMTVHSKCALPLRAGFLLVPYNGTTPPEMALCLNGDQVLVEVDRKQRTLSFSEAMR